MTERHKDRLRTGTDLTRALEGFRQNVKTLTFLGAAGVSILVSSLTSANTHEPHENIMAAATQAVLAMPEVQNLTNPAITPNNLDDRLRLTRCS